MRRRTKLVFDGFGLSTGQLVQNVANCQPPRWGGVRKPEVVFMDCDSLDYLRRTERLTAATVEKQWQYEAKRWNQLVMTNEQLQNIAFTKKFVQKPT